MRPHTMEGEDRPRGVTSRRVGRRSRRADAGPGAAILGALVVLVLVGIVAYLALGKAGAQPPATPPAPTARALTAGERATLVAASRAIGHGENPFVSGLDPERTVALRALADEIEAGRAGARWPTFRTDAGTAGYLNALQVEILVLDGSEQSKRNGEDLEEKLRPMVSALDAGDLVAAQRAHERWRSAFDSLRPSR